MARAAKDASIGLEVQTTSIAWSIVTMIIV